MDLTEIILIIIGIILIIVSCILVEHSQEKGNGLAAGAVTVQNQNSEQEIKQMKEKLKDLLSEISEETVVRTDDSLSRLSNEKIMAVNEFSDQILEKIKHNHEEVVFLYNMLNEKEKDVKSDLREIDSSRKKMQEIIESKNDILKTQTLKKPAVSGTSQHPAAAAIPSTKPVKTEQRSSEGTAEAISLSSVSSNNNSEILALYTHGKSVMEISKLLGLGQGEVKLVIDLFKGKK